jgi:uncharacterized membrane protein
MAADGSDARTPGPEPADAGRQDDPTTERLITLTDAVVAIALTLLILGIQVPSPAGLHNPNSVTELAGALRHTLNGWVSYAISFYVIAQFWTIHHKAFRGIRGHRGGLAGWNFVFLLTISVMPFTSELIGKYPENPLSVIIFSGNLILANLAIFAVLAFALRHGMLTAKGRESLDRHHSLQAVIDMSFYVVAIPVALVSPDLAKCCWFGLALSPHIVNAIDRRRGARPA